MGWCFRTSPARRRCLGLLRYRRRPQIVLLQKFIELHQESPLHKSSILLVSPKVIYDINRTSVLMLIAAGTFSYATAESESMMSIDGASYDYRVVNGSSRHDVVVARKMHFYGNFSSSDILKFLNLCFKDFRNLIPSTCVFYDGNKVSFKCNNISCCRSAALNGAHKKKFSSFVIF